MLQLSSPRGLVSCNSSPRGLESCSPGRQNPTNIVGRCGSLKFCRYRTFLYVFQRFSVGFDDPGKPGWRPSGNSQVPGDLRVAVRIVTTQRTSLEGAGPRDSIKCPLSLYLSLVLLPFLPVPATCLPYARRRCELWLPPAFPANLVRGHTLQK